MHKCVIVIITNNKINYLRKNKDVEKPAPKHLFIHIIHTLET